MVLRAGLAALWLFCCYPLWADEPVRLHGKFVRADLVTDDLATVSAFYAKLFDWQLVKYKDHTRIVAQGRELGSIVERERPPNKEAKSRWIAFMSVADVASIRQKVAAAGGQVLLEPQELQGTGIAAVFSDPQGAVFGAIHNRHGDPEDFIADVGSWIWLELFTHDVGQAAEFYASVGNYEIWDYEPQSAALKERKNVLLASDGYARAAVTELAKERAHAKAVWLPFIRVANTALIIQQAQALGGGVLVAPSPDILNGRAAVLVDPRGAAVGIMEWTAQDSDEGSDEQ